MRAIEKLRSLRKGELADELSRRYLLGSGRGRRPPQEGDERPYKVQRQKTDEGTALDFVRVPTALIGATRGGVVMIRFSKRRIIITPLDPDETPIDVEDDVEDDAEGGEV